MSRIHVRLIPPAPFERCLTFIAVLYTNKCLCTAKKSSIRSSQLARRSRHNSQSNQCQCQSRNSNNIQMTKLNNHNMKAKHLPSPKRSLKPPFNKSPMPLKIHTGTC